MRQGYILIHRSLFEHPAFNNDAERMAFIRLIGDADYKTGTVRASLSYLAKQWGWTKSRVQRFVNRLQREGMADTVADTKAIRITLCNYHKFQKSGVNTDTLPDTKRIPTKNTKPKKSSSRGTRLEASWTPSPQVWAWALENRPDLDLALTLEAFSDYWRSVPGQKGVKLDWDLTFKNWVRRENARHKPTNTAATKTTDPEKARSRYRSIENGGGFTAEYHRPESGGSATRREAEGSGVIIDGLFERVG